ncbi:MAG: DUF1822 family protein [Thermosynechococcaceae cyanobacterium]
MHSTDPSFILPITTIARQTAEQFSAQQTTHEKREQVRLNTLAVWVVYDYLDMMGIPCNLDASDSWNPVVRAVADVADLEVAGSGRLECRPIRTTEKTCPLPPEVWVDRIGYLVVQISDDLRQANLMGFMPTAATAQIRLEQLSPLESLLAHLSEFSLAPPSTPEDNWHQMGQWLRDIFSDGWQTVDSLLGHNGLALSFRRAEVVEPMAVSEGQVQQAKLLSLAGAPVVLVVDCYPQDHQRLFCIQVHPLSNGTYLPVDLRLVISDGVDQPLLKATANPDDDCIQQQFSGYPGERFSVTVALGEESITERFIV